MPKHFELHDGHLHLCYAEEFIRLGLWPKGVLISAVPLAAEDSRFKIKKVQDPKLRPKIKFPPSEPFPHESRSAT